MISLFGIVLALGLLMFLAFRGISVLLLAPIMALFAVLWEPAAPVMATYTQIFMPAVGTFVIAFFPLFLLGAVFGRLMELSGAAHIIASTVVEKFGKHHTILAIVLSCAILTYGGVSLFVVAFAVYPIAASMFAHSHIPKRLIPGAIALGSFTFTMTALPGTPAIQNAIPMPYFDTTLFAAPGLGVIAGIIMLIFGMWWLRSSAHKAQEKGEDYGEGFDHPDGEHLEEITPSQFWLALTPVVAVVALNYIFSEHIFPGMDTAYLAETKFGATSIESLKGIWAVIAALAISIVMIAVLERNRFTSITKALSSGAEASVMPLLNTASLVGFGAVIASLAGFAMVRDAVLGFAPGNPLISLSIAVNLLAGITGSASGGMSIALQTLGETWRLMAEEQGISLELFHRVTSIATGGLDALPHNGAVITLLSICGLTHKQSYKDIFLVAAIGPIIALIAIIVLGTAFGSF